MARFTFRLPDIGEGIAEAEIVAWHVKIGDRVEEDQQIADMMTDKATIEMESPVSGVVVEMAGEPGDRIPIGSALVVFETDAAEPAKPEPAKPAAAKAEAPPAEFAQAAPIVIDPGSTAAQPAPQPLTATPATHTAPHPEAQHPHIHVHMNTHVLASPAVRQRARELGVDLSQVKAEGPRVRHADLDAFLRYGAGQGYTPAANRARPDQAIKVIGMRRRIADNMAASKRNIPHFTYVDEIEVTALEAMREALNGHRGDRPKLTVLPFLLVAMCRTLPEFPMLNARFDDEAGIVTRHGCVHIGIATQTDAGLMVPVLRDAQNKNIWQLAGEIRRLSEAARTGKAKSEELSGGTITVTSLGPLGGIATTPVINRPEVAIIGPNKIVERPVFDGDDLRRAKLMNLSISCDHRVVDGWDAASYVQALKKLLETPALIFVD
jgi:2-oxoisovalerate dehydrogenase E2 component (dihydrolipoyl transacylase)